MALASACRDANLVLIRRRTEALAERVRECEELGARAIAVPTDVTDERAVKDAAKQAIDSFGPHDVWVNNAGVALFGRIEDTAYEDYRRSSKRTCSAISMGRARRCAPAAIFFVR